MAEVKFIKIAPNIFDDEAIKIIESMPDGDCIIVIWFKLLAAAGQVNDGGFVYFKENIPYTVEMLATVLNRPINTIRLALKTFENFGMIEIFDDKGILISNWAIYQNIEGLEKIREQNRIRKQNERQRKKEEQQKLLSDNSHVTCHVTVTDSHAPDKEEDKEIDKEEEISLSHEGDGEEEKLRERDKNNLLRILERDKSIKNPNAYARALINNGDWERYLKQNEKNNKSSSPPLDEAVEKVKSKEDAMIVIYKYGNKSDFTKSAQPLKIQELMNEYGFESWNDVYNELAKS